MFRREKTIYIAAAPEAVFQYVADIRRHGEWGAQAWDITLEPGPAHGPGTTFAASAKTGLFGRSLIRIVTEEPPVRFVYDCLDWSGHHRWSMFLAPEGEGTRLRYQLERLQGPWWMRLAQPILIWPLAGRRSVQTGLANLKAILEADHLANQQVKRLAI
jgi:hypothetical protein